MPWKVINYGRAENADDNVAVHRTGFRSLVYSRGDRSVHIDVEAGDNDLGVYKQSIERWEETGERIGEDERARIMADVTTALRLLRVPFTWE